MRTTSVGMVVAAIIVAGTAYAGEPFCFAVVADPHCSEGVTKGLESCGNGADRFIKAIKTMEAMPPEDKPDFILLLGDVHPDALKARMAEVTIPVHATPGNHEATSETRAVLRSLFPNDFKIKNKPADYYSFIHKGVRFISMCDAGAGGDHIGHFCSEITEPSGQCEWIESELRAPEPLKIMFAHIPTERDGQESDMHLSRNDSRWFNALLKDTQPLAAFFGHLHHPTDSYTVGQTTVFEVRSCCWNFQETPIGFLLCHITDGKLETREVLTSDYTRANRK